MGKCYNFYNDKISERKKSIRRIFSKERLAVAESELEKERRRCVFAVEDGVMPAVPTDFGVMRKSESFLK